MTGVHSSPRLELAVVLAAGAGKRLGEAARGRPKGLIRIGTETLMDRSLRLLAQVGIRRAILVIGHRAGAYRSHFANRRKAPDLRLVENRNWEQGGSLSSLACALDHVDQPFLLLESDLIYEERALSALLEHSASDVLLASGPTHAGDEVWVRARNGVLADLSKTDLSKAALPEATIEVDDEIVGEMVGICKISPGVARLAVRASSSQTKNRPLHYETDGLVTAASERPVSVHILPDLIWGELDDGSHLRRLRRFIGPRLRESGSGRTA